MVRPLLVGVVLAGMVVACGGSVSSTTPGAGPGPSPDAGPPPPVTITGTDSNGRPFDVSVTEGTAMIGVDSYASYVGGSSWGHADIILTSFPGACGALQSTSPSFGPGGTTLWLTAEDQSGTDIKPGEYVYHGETSRSAAGLLRVTDAACGSTTDTILDQGTITITEVSPTVVRGTFNVWVMALSNIPTRTNLIGTFDAPRCAIPAARPLPTVPVCAK
jgi:hypothetical protein